MPAIDLPALTRLQAAIVDLDGTLIDTLGDFDVALNAMLGELRLGRIERGFIARTVGKGSAHLIRSLLAQVGANAAVLDEAMACYQRHYVAINGDHAAVYPGVVEGLDALRARGFKLACLTNKPIAFALPLLRKKGLAERFDAIFGGDSFERQKPDPLPLRMTCEALGSEPARTLMVGDSSNDALAARAAGCPVVLVRYGYNHGVDVGSVDADAVIDSLEDLRAMLGD